MSHLHIPDGVLPVVVWAPGLALALVLLLLSAWRTRTTPEGRGPAAGQRVAYQGSLGALVLAAMAIEIPLGPFEYHLTLVGPVGVLLGAAASFQVVLIASAILAFVGHGGVTVVGLNALVLGAGAAVARLAYEVLAGRVKAPLALAAATACGQAVAGALWLLVVGLGMRADAGGPARLGLFAAIAFPMWAVGVAVEAAVAFGIGRFLARVRPDLLPGHERHGVAVRAA